MEAEYQRRFERVVNQIERELDGSKDFAHTVESLLKCALYFYDADRVYIVEADTEIGLCSVTHEYCAPGVVEQMSRLQKIDINIYRSWSESYSTGSPTIIGDIDEIKSVDMDEYAFLKEFDVQSLLAVCLNKKIPGFFAVVNPHRYQAMPSLLQTLSYAVTSEITEQNLRDAVQLKSSAYPVTAEKEILINFFSGLEVITPIGVLNEESIKSAMCCKLVAYLYLTRPRTVSLLELSEHIWHEQEKDNPAGSVKSLVYRCRKIFAPICPEHLVEYTGSGYTLNRSFTYRSDIDEFEKLCNQTKYELDVRKRFSLYHKALRLYTGTVLPNHDYELWLGAKANYYNLMYFSTVNQCLDLLFQHRMYFEAVQLANHALVFNKTDSDLNFYLIKALLLQGGTDYAEKHFQSAYSYLSDEHRKEYYKILSETT